MISKQTDDYTDIAAMSSDKLSVPSKKEFNHTEHDLPVVADAVCVGMTRPGTRYRHPGGQARSQPLTVLHTWQVQPEVIIINMNMKMTVSYSGIAT